jgi:hypothetical protein
VNHPPLTRSRHVAVAASFAALALVWTWPLATQLASRIPHDPGDPILNTYLIWWNAATLPLGPGWWDPPFFYPMRGALALSEHLAGLAILSSPVQLLGGNAILAYNLSLLASYALSAWFTFLLVRRLTGSTPAAICAGLAYGFAPFRAGQLAHLQVLTSQWVPLQLFAMHAYLDDGRKRWLALTAAAWLLQALSNGYYLLFVPTLIVLWLAWFPDWRQAPRRGLALAGAWAAGSLPLVPVLMKYREVHGLLGLRRGEAEIAGFSATPSSFLNPPELLAFWPPRSVLLAEDFLFPGVTVVVILVAGIITWVARGKIRGAFRRRSRFLFYMLAAVMMAAFTFGPGNPESGEWRWLRPYYWLSFLPGYASLRVPARFAMLFTLCSTVTAGIALARLLPARRPVHALVVGAVAAGFLIDGWMEPFPLIAPAGRLTAADVPPDAAVLELPPDETSVSVNAMYRAVFHGRPLINGYSGHVPPHYSILGHSLRRDDPTALLELARGRKLVLIVNALSDPAGDFRQIVESLPGVTRTSSGSAGTIYLLPAQPSERVAPSGSPLAFTSTFLPREHVILDLGETSTVRTLEFPLRWRYVELGRRFAVEASLDGKSWQMRWLDWTGGRAMAGALEDPRLIPFRIPLPDITARYLRIHPAPDWMIREMRVLGP